MNLAAIRRAVGNGIYLWLLLLHSAERPEGAEWWTVAQGRIIPDVQLAWYLGCSESTARRYRLTLERAGLVEAVHGRGGNVLRVKSLDVLDPDDRAPARQAEASAPQSNAIPESPTGGYIQ